MASKEMTRGARVYRESYAEGLRPPPPVSVAEWANEHLRLDDTTSAEPGRYRVERTPYVREPMECLSATSPIQKVVLCWGAQLGKSTTGNAWVGYVMDNSPGPMLAVQPRVQDALDYSRLRIEPMIAASPALQKRISSKWVKDGTNTLSTKKFPGGVLLVTGANSAAGLKSRPIRYLFLDEVDEYPWDVQEQGDPLTLAIRRTNTFGHRRKILVTSTPTVEGKSRIDTEYEQSDRRQYWVPCVRCGEYQVLEFSQLKWPKGKPEEVQYECVHCNRRFAEVAKREFLPAGEWRAQDETRLTAGFHLPSWYSPLGWLSWKEIATEWVEGHDDPNSLKVFVNSIMAETFEDRGEAPDWQRLFDRREPYPQGICPEGTVFLTVGVDVQKDRLEAFVWGWGYKKESWFVDHIVMPGDPYNEATWGPLTDLLHATYPGVEAGTSLPIASLAIDTGYAQEPVVSWARSQADRRIMLVKGDHWKNWNVIVGSPTKSEVTLDGKKTGLLLWPVGGALIKQETYGFLDLETPEDDEPYPAGWIHLPRWTSQELCKQFVAEDLKEGVDSKGYPTREFVPHRHRNEMLDGRVYARAAAERQGLSRMKKDEGKAKKKTDRDDGGKKKGGWLDRGGRGRGRRGGGGWLDR